MVPKSDFSTTRMGERQISLRATIWSTRGTTSSLVETLPGVVATPSRQHHDTPFAAPQGANRCAGPRRETDPAMDIHDVHRKANRACTQ